MRQQNGEGHLHSNGLSVTISQTTKYTDMPFGGGTLKGIFFVFTAQNKKASTVKANLPLALHAIQKGKFSLQGQVAITEGDTFCARQCS